MSTTIIELEKAVKSLEEAIILYESTKDDIQKRAFRDAAIQRFEFSIELSWKTSMKILGSTTSAAKNAIREMARNDLIDDPTTWLNFIEGHNETPHSYDEDVAQKVFTMIQKFLPFAKKLILNLNTQEK